MGPSVIPNLFLVFMVLSFLQIVAAFSFKFANAPQQCRSLVVNITDPGQPPYSFLILPAGNQFEQPNAVYSTPFNSTSSQLMVPYKPGRQIVALVSS